MKRRPFIKLLSANIISLPILGSGAVFLATKNGKENWVAQLLEEGQVESVSSFWVHDLPFLPKEVQSGEFIASSKKVYFYQQRKFCFQVFEKAHPVLEKLELMVPFWQKNADGTWKRMLTLNAFDLKALAKAAENDHAAADLLPLGFQPATSSFFCHAGLLYIKTRIEAADSARTEISITNTNQQSWSMDFSSTQNLPKFLI